jgi:mannose-1-phosphate guanylyltransferase/mannose-1-phosphate guanylyltransferase/mannose-6-phosphate isomerase
MGHGTHYEKDERPWGLYERFTLNEPSTVKLITVNAGEAFSLQKHEHRDEFWRIIDGKGKVTVGSESREVLPGDEIEIAHDTLHRLEAVGGKCLFLEIAYGTFDENDIIRVDDKYGRV